MHKKWIVLVLVILVLLVVGVFLSASDFSSEEVDSDVYEIESPSTISDASVLFINVSDYPIAPGMIIVHDPEFHMGVFKQLAPPALESLAEVGDPAVAIDFYQYLSDVYDVFETPPIPPRESRKITVPVSASNAQFSYVAMILSTNDGVIFARGQSLYDSDGTPRTANFTPQVLDMGFEENSPIGSGFAGGQPDPSRGDENIDNGVPLREPADNHPQFYDDPEVSRRVLKIGVN